MKKSTKTMIKLIVTYGCEMALTCMGSFVGGKWAARAKTPIGMIARIGGVSALCFGSSALAAEGVVKLLGDYEDQVDEEKFIENSTLPIDD